MSFGLSLVAFIFGINGWELDFVTKGIVKLYGTKKMYNDDDFLRCFKCGDIIENKSCIMQNLHGVMIAWCTNCEKPDPEYVKRLEGPYEEDPLE